MWFSSWLRIRTDSRKHRPANRFRPTLEVLEDRAVPATFMVNTTADVLGHDNGMISLRQAILDANATPAVNTIVLSAAKYTLTLAGAGETVGRTGDLDIWATSKSPLTIRGAGAGSTIVDGGGLDRVFDVHMGGTVILSGMTIQGGSLSNSNYGGGAILNWGGLTVEGCTISGNHVDTGAGGGIYNVKTLTVSNSTIASNSAKAFGGGIYSTNSTTVMNSTLSGNHASGGGGIYQRGGALTVDGSTVSGNSAGQGGGILTNSGAKAVVTNSTLSGNSAGVYGGAMYNWQGTLTVSNCTLSGNDASQGAGICNYGGTVTIDHGNFSNNSGVAIWNKYYSFTVVGSVTIQDSTVTGNTGGGILNESGCKLTVMRSQLTRNVGFDLSGTASIFNSTIGDVYYS